jgi:hypothetical protein
VTSVVTTTVHKTSTRTQTVYAVRTHFPLAVENEGAMLTINLDSHWCRCRWLWS